MPWVLLQSTPDGGERILIGDLGTAKSLAYASGFTNACGTPGYMAPGQAIPGFGLDIRADVYGLGALTYHLITGQKYSYGTATNAELPKRPDPHRPPCPQTRSQPPLPPTPTPSPTP